MNIENKFPRRNKFGFFLLLFAYIYFAVFSYNIADYQNYKLIYEVYAPKSSMAGGVVDTGFYLLCRLCNFIGIPFPMFRGFYIAVALFILIKGVQRYDKNSNIPLLLYLFFPFALDVVQFRTFLVSAIVIYSIRFLEEKNILKYIFAIVMAATQQITAVFFLLLLIIYVDKKKLVKSSILVSLMELMFLPVATSAVLGKFGQALSHYMGYASSSYSRRLCLLYFVMTIFLLLYQHFFIKSKDKTDEILTKILLALLMLIPFIMLNENFTRLYRGLVVLIYCRLFRRTSNAQTFVLKSFMAFAFCGIMFYIHLSPHNISHWKNIIIPMFENNYILDFVRIL